VRASTGTFASGAKTRHHPATTAKKGVVEKDSPKASAAPGAKANAKASTKANAKTGKATVAKAAKAKAGRKADEAKTGGKTSSKVKADDVAATAALTGG